MRRRSYHSYRGRSPWKSFFKFLAILMIVLAVLAGAAVLYVQQYLVVTADGVRLELPFLQQDDDPADTPSPVISDPPVVVIEPSPEPEPEPEPLPAAPVSLSREALYDGTAPAQIGEAAGDCALFDMKDDKGTLAFTSDALTRYSGQPSSGGDNEAIRALNETEGLYTIARVSCFRDDTLFYYSSSYPLYANSGDRWIDPDRIHWLAPTCADVRDYLIGVCVELAGLGFDEILLDNAGYPTQGNLHYIRKGDAYDPDQFADVIGGFYGQVAAALSEYDVVLSVVTTQEALDGTDTLSGQTPESLARFDRLWTVGEEGGAAPVPMGSNVS